MVKQHMPLDFSEVTDFLAISAWPKAEHINEIQNLGVHLILSMHWWKPSKTLETQEIKLLWLPTFDNPIFRIPISTLLRGVNASKPVIQSDGKILVHCQAGVHRSVAMACCILISTNMTADQAMRLVKQKRPIADPDIWYIQSRIRKFERMLIENPL
jgi:dual specificity phosphatase 12